jgi:hypothetical protein
MKSNKKSKARSIPKNIPKINPKSNTKSKTRNDTKNNINNITKVNRDSPRQKQTINFKTNYYSGRYDNDSESPSPKNIEKFFSPETMNNDYDFDFQPHKPISVIRVNQKMKKYKNNSNKTSSSNIHQTRNKNKKVDIKGKKKLNISVRNNNNRNKMSKNTLNSNSTINKDYSTINYSVKNERYFSPSNRNVDVNEMMERFQKVLNRKKEWLENQKKKKEEEEKKIYSHAPKINKISQIKFKDDFFERQKIKEEQKKKKEEKLREFLSKKEEEEINKNNPLLNKSKGKKNSNLNLGNISTKTLNKNKKATINKAINKLYEWDEKRKEKINEKRKKNDEKLNNIKYVPKINKRSASMAELNKQKYKEKNIFNRLAQQDPFMLEKRKLLEQLYTPTFKPNINVKKAKPKEDENNENENGNENEDDEDSEKHLEEEGIKNLESQYISDDNIQELYRNALFQGRKFNLSQSVE